MLIIAKTAYMCYIRIRFLKEKTMQTCQVSELYSASNEDVLHLPSLLQTVPEKIYVRNLWYETVLLLSDLAHPPFEVNEEDGYFVLYGLDAATLEPASLRIIRENGLSNVLQYRNKKFKEWGKSPIGNILLLPISVLKIHPM